MYVNKEIKRQKKILWYQWFSIYLESSKLVSDSDPRTVISAIIEIKIYFENRHYLIDYY